MKTDLPALTGLRGVAALWVLAFHVWLLSRGVAGDGRELVGLPARAGYLGVDLFFVLSGFVIALNYASAELHRSPAGYACFLWKRLARIWPVHFATSILLGVVLAGCIVLDIAPKRLPVASDFLYSLTLTHAWAVPVPPIWNLVSWSISAEWAAYLAFPAIAWAALRVRSQFALVALVVTLFVAMGLGIEAVHYRGTMAYGMHRIAAEFTAGVLLFRLWQLRDDRGVRAWGVAAAVALVGFVLGAGAFEHVVGYGSALPIFPVLAAVVVYGLAAGDGPVVRTLASQPLQYLGRTSFALYLGHGPIMQGAEALLIRHYPLGGGTALAATATAAVVLSLALAHWIHRSIEEPARRAMIGFSPRAVGTLVAGLAAPQRTGERPTRR